MWPMTAARGFLFPAGPAADPSPVPSATFKAVADDTVGAFTLLEYVRAGAYRRTSLPRAREPLRRGRSGERPRGRRRVHRRRRRLVFAPQPPHSLTALSDAPPASSPSPVPAVSSTSWRTSLPGTTAVPRRSPRSARSTGGSRSSVAADLGRVAVRRE